MIISELFVLIAAKSKSTDDYDSGKVPFVTNTEMNNGVVSYVTPFHSDKVIEKPAICISGLGHATVHLDPFLPKGNGGDSCTILIPKQEMTNIELLYYASLFNTLHRWRFSFGRKASKRRIEHLNLSPHYEESPIRIEEHLEKNNALMKSLLLKKEVEFSN